MGQLTFWVAVKKHWAELALALGVDGQVLLLTAVLGLALMHYLMGWKRRRAHAVLKKIPGPSGMPLLGNWLALSRRHNRQNQLLNWCNKYGGIFRLNIWGTPCVVISDPRAASQVLAYDGDDMPKHKPHYKSIDEVLHPKNPSMLTSTTTNNQWRTVRKCIMHAFRTSELKEDMEICKAKALMLVEVMAGLGPGVVVDMDDAALRYSLDVMGLAKLGYDFEAVDTEEEVLMLKLMRECVQEWAYRQAFPPRRYLWWASDEYAEGRHKYQIMQGFLSELWSSIKRRGPPPEDDTTLAAQLVRLRDPVTAQPMASELVVAELGSLLLAGHESVGHALSWALYCLANHQGVQDKLYAELQREGLVNRFDQLSFDGLTSLPYLDCVLREALRLYPTFGDGMMREAHKDVQLGPYKVPKGTMVWVHNYAMQRAESLWQDGNRFNPERWSLTQDAAVKLLNKGVAPGSYDGFCTLAEAGATGASSSTGSAAADAAACSSKSTSGKDGAGPSSSKTAASSSSSSQGASSSTKAEGAGGSGGLSAGGPALCAPQAFMPFSAGTRSCAGQQFAQVALKSALAMLVAFFKFEPSSDFKDTYAETVNLTLMPRNGIPLMISLRNPHMFTDA